jgi:hypothetical protein
MRRRNFILTSGSAVLSGLVASGIQRPAIGLNFEISTPDKDPSKVDSLVIEFETLEITPKYLDEKEPVSVQAKVEVAGQVEKSNKVQTSVANGETKNLKNNIDSLVVDGLNVSESISGEVTVSIDHPEVQDSYSRNFRMDSSDIPDSFVYDFETGDVSRWDATTHLTTQNNRVYSGSYAGHTDIRGTYNYLAVVSSNEYPTQPSGFEYFWQEKKIESFGGGIRLLNSNGEVEVGLASNNPEWTIDDGNGIYEVFSGDGYNRWVRFKITFDWENGTFSTDFEDLKSGSTYSDSGRPLKQGTDIAKMRLETYETGTWTGGDDYIEMWWDNISLFA